MTRDFQLADNNKWYEHAIVGEPKKWYMYFDNDTIELLIRKMRSSTSFSLYIQSQPYMPVEKLIQKFKLPIKIIKKNLDLDCMFPDSRGRWAGKLFQTVSYTVDLVGPIPSKLIICFTEVCSRRPKFDGTYWDGTIKV